MAYLRDYLLRDAEPLGSRRMEEGRFGEVAEAVTSGWASRGFTEVCWEVKRRGAPVVGVWEDPAGERGGFTRGVSRRSGDGGGVAASSAEQVSERCVADG